MRRALGSVDRPRSGKIKSEQVTADQVRKLLRTASKAALPGTSGSPLASIMKLWPRVDQKRHGPPAPAVDRLKACAGAAASSRTRAAPPATRRGGRGDSDITLLVIAISLSIRRRRRRGARSSGSRASAQAGCVPALEQPPEAQGPSESPAGNSPALP